eukprot:Stramenopile-MAST_4_protein_4262
MKCMQRGPLRTGLGGIRSESSQSDLRRTSSGQRLAHGHTPCRVPTAQHLLLAPSSSAQTVGMKENKNPTPSLDAAKRPPTRFPPRAATNAADPFASFAAASSGVSKITVDFSKLPSMGSDSDESDEDADESGVSKSPIRSSDVHQEIFGVPRTVPNAKHSVVLTTEPTDVDGLD